MLDKLPPMLRHLVLMLAAALLSWAGTDLVPWLNGQPGWGALAGVFTAALIAYLTPLVKQYGLFQDGRHEATGDRTEGVDTGTAT